MVFDPDGLRLPIKIDTTSNGEFEPIALSKPNMLANQRALLAASANARRQGRTRRGFLRTCCGAATTLLAMNEVNALAGKTGGYFDVPNEASMDSALADGSLGGGEFIFDVQGHYVDPTGAWLAQVPQFARPFASMVKSECEQGGDDPRAYLQCLGPEAFIKDVFLDSDTDLMVLSFVPSTADAEPVTIQAADATRRIVDRMEGDARLLLHGRVNPNQPHDMDNMDELAERWGISAWKTYTQFGPGGVGYYLDDDVGIAFIEKARALGVKVICVHKGLPLGSNSYEHSQCRDIGVVAKRFPDVSFIVYHSGYVAGRSEGPYSSASRDGVDTLIKSLLDNGIGPNSNVYAELGSTWRFLMREPNDAAHVIGKLLKYCGENNVLWGSDSLWYGSPQDQIQAFRAFQISAEFQERFGYPAITGEIRRKVFGLNACVPYGIEMEEVQRHLRGDAIARLRANYQNAPDPHFATYGPKTRREFFNLIRNGG